VTLHFERDAIAVPNINHPGIFAWTQPTIQQTGTIKIRDRNNTLLYESAGNVGRQMPVGYDALPRHLIDAVIASEDSTFWTNPTPLAYVAQQNDPWSELIQACFLVIQLIGTIAFIRGLIMLTHLSQHGGHQGTFGKAMAHIVGGILLIDMYDFVTAVGNTLGLGQV